MINGFSINGSHCCDLNILMRTSQRPVLPQFKFQYDTVPGKDGAYDFSDGTLDDAIITIECALITSRVGELRYWTREVGAWLYGAGKKIKIVFDDEPDLYYFGRVANQIDPEQLATIGQFSLQFRCDPFAYSKDDVNVDMVGDMNIILFRDRRLDDTFTYPVSGNTTFEINNYGTAAVKPNIMVNGSFSSLIIKVGEQNFIYSESISGQTLMIDNERYQVKVGNVNKLNKVSGDFIKLSAGINQVSVNGTGLNCTVSFVFHPKFV